MQLTAIRDEVRNRAGMDSADAMLSDTVLNDFINAALREVNNMRDWDWSVINFDITTIVGTAAYARPVAARNTIRIVDEDEGYLLMPITADAATRYAGVTGRPRFYYVEAGAIYFVPTPNSVRTYNHYYYNSETTLSNDTDEPTIPDYAIDLVVIKAALMATARMDNTSQHMLLRQAEKNLSESLQDDARRSKGSPVINTRRDWSRGRGWRL